MNKFLVLLLFVFSISISKSQIFEQDSLALVALFNSTNGENWGNNDFWLSNQPIGEWYGISVKDNRVIKIVLPHNYLSGDIPQEIGNLDSLSLLDLSLDSIFNIPSTIGNLSTLDTLWLFVTEIDSLPDEIGNLHDLKYLGLGFTLIRELPETIGGLNHLEKLSVSHAKLTHIPESIGNLSAVRIIDLQVNEISNLPSSIGNCINLVELWLNANNIPEIPSEIGNLTDLEYLILGGNNLQELPDEIFTLTNLRYLNFAANYLTFIPTQIGNLINLENFQFFENNFTSIPAEIGNLINLNYINGYSNKIDTIPLSLLNLPDVHTLFLAYNSLTFDDIEPLVSINGFEYDNQDSLGRNIDTTVEVNSSYRFECLTGGEFNLYQWLKDDDTIYGATEYFFELPQLAYSDSGEYRCVVTNSLATGLTLFSKPARLHITNYSIIKDPVQDLSGQVVIYPNPAKDKFFIKLDEIIYSSGADIIIYNSFGFILEKYEVVNNNIHEIDISHLNPGIYLIQVIDKSVIKNYSQKLIVL